jgi:predicted enzyme related to lactoylglutathione lyase
MRNVVLLMLLLLCLTGSAFAQGDEGAPAAGGMPAPVLGAIEFIELASTDLEVSTSFYTDLFGWEVGAMPGMEMPTMTFFTDAGGRHGAFSLEMQAAAAGTGPVLYISVDGVAAKLAEIEAAGGATVMGSMELPMNMGFIAQFTDPSGNTLGLWSMTP